MKNWQPPSGLNARYSVVVLKATRSPIRNSSRFGSVV